jgi:hypothetical protein
LDRKPTLIAPGRWIGLLRMCPKGSPFQILTLQRFNGG